MKTVLTVVIPCYNEENTLIECVSRVRSIADLSLCLEIIIVDDCSEDSSLQIARNLATQYNEVRVLQHDKNQGKGAALKSGFQYATGDFVAVQDADLEYDPNDLKRLIVPLQDGKADVVLGSRFCSSGAHRVFYFWHYMGNRFLTFLSNMFTDLNLTDMETCYKIFRRDVIQSIDIKEKRFGFEPEIVAKVAHKRLRVYEMGITYNGRTYAEGKKITARDGFRALYCILRYNAHQSPLPIQFLIYLFIGGTAAVVNLGFFLFFLGNGLSVTISVLAAFSIAAVINYLLCIWVLFRHKVKWGAVSEVIIFISVVAFTAALDLFITKTTLLFVTAPAIAKLAGIGTGFIFNFLGRRFLVFPEKQSDPWQK